MRKYVSILIICSFLLMMSGCATIFKGSKSPLTLASTPEGARVMANGVEVCSATPCAVKLASNKNYQIVFMLDGFKDKSVQVDKQIGILWLILDLVGIVPLIVDAATGNWNSLEPEYIQVTLDKK